MDEELDRLLNEALAEYSAAPERPKLEHRVLARLRQARRRKAWWLAIGSAAAAAVVTGVLLMSPRIGKSHRERLPVSVSVSKAEPVLVPAAAPQLKIAVLKRAIVRTRGAPKRAEFPTPAPLTPQERALEEIRRMEPGVIADLNRPVELLSVPPLQLKPLSPSGT